jgi:hypothetical protein
MFALLCALSFLAALPNATAVAGDTNAPVVLICTTHGHPKPGDTKTDLSLRVVAALWNDGKIVWSESRLRGGPPYRQGQFTREKMDALLGSLEAQGAFTNATLRRPWFGPDSQTTRIVIDDGRRRLKLESWHELFEQNTNLVATAQGITSLNGRERDAVLAGQPEEYRHFRKTWSEVRDAVASLIPPKGEPCDGPVLAPKN